MPELDLIFSLQTIVMLRAYVSPKPPPDPEIAAHERPTRVWDIALLRENVKMLPQAFCFACVACARKGLIPSRREKER
jgi:hypothetical protein